ncbi:MAG: S8 family peptidase [Cytophagaceae bacterium]|nr:S8 family peptidase [Cytophagaceae bacterium]
MNFHKGIWIALLSFITVFSSCEYDAIEDQPKPIASPEPSPEPAPAPQNPDECITKPAADNGTVIPKQYIVKYKDEEEELHASASDALAKKTGLQRNAFRAVYKRGFAAKMSNEEAERFKQDPHVETVEPDRVVSIVSCYTEVNEQSTPWGVTRVGSGDATGKSVWIIDTGVDMDHPDLIVDATRSKSFIEGATPEDDHGHGTHVAGTIAAKNNLIGVQGVAYNAKIIALKVMDASGRGSMSNVIAAVNHVAANGKPGDVVNMSIGGDISEILDNAIIAAAEKGILFAVAAGNDAVRANTSSPARVNHPNVFTVSAMNNQDVFAAFSNYGNECVDFCAPGVSIPSTHKNGGYATMSGTSMATPHVAGLLLLNGVNILKDGVVKEDPDGLPDPIAHK